DYIPSGTTYKYQRLFFTTQLRVLNLERKLRQLSHFSSLLHFDLFGYIKIVSYSKLKNLIMNKVWLWLKDFSFSFYEWYACPIE
ncbi:hypothetical protein CR513_58095, partial [Mucuna pruriens]